MGFQWLSGSDGEVMLFTEGGVRKEGRGISLGSAALKGAAKHPSAVFPEKLHQPGVLHGLSVQGAMLKVHLGSASNELSGGMKKQIKIPGASRQASGRAQQDR